MPEMISIYAVAVWFVVGLAVGFGWGLGTALAARLTR